MKHLLTAASLMLGSACFAYDIPAIYQGADIKQGEKLIAQHQCTACHMKKVGGDGSAIYKPAGKVNSLGALRGMVEACDQQLNLGLFPEEVNSVSAVINRDHYRFK